VSSLSMYYWPVYRKELEEKEKEKRVKLEK
jgi:hypothetical protein